MLREPVIGWCSEPRKLALGIGLALSSATTGNATSDYCSATMYGTTSTKILYFIMMMLRVLDCSVRHSIIAETKPLELCNFRH